MRSTPPLSAADTGAEGQAANERHDFPQRTTRSVSIGNHELSIHGAWAGTRRNAADEGLYLHSIAPAAVFLTTPAVPAGDAQVGVTVSNVVAHHGGIAVTLFDHEEVRPEGWTEEQHKASAIASVYFADNSASPESPDRLAVFYYTTAGELVSLNRRGEWQRGWHLTGAAWDPHTTYHVAAERTAEHLRLTVQADDRVLVEAPPLPLASLRHGDRVWKAVVGDPSVAHTAGSMVLRSANVNGQGLDMARLNDEVPEQSLVEGGLPTFGLFSFEGGQGFIQLPAAYDPRMPHPLILFFHGRGGSAAASNLLMEDFDRFRQEARQQGYILAVPDYGSDSWMNPRGEQVTLAMLTHLESHLSIDPRRFYVMGTSMGGAAALTFAARGHRPVAALCNIFGITDMERFYEEGRYNESIAAAYGGTPQERPEAYRERSAVRHIDRLKNIPLIILHGDRDTTVPLSHGQALFDLLQAAGADARLEVAANVAHDNRIIRGREQQVLEFFGGHPASAGGGR